MENQELNWEQALEGATTPEQRLNALLELVSINANQDFVAGWKYADEALQLAMTQKNREAEAKAHEGMANCLWKLAELTQALDHFELALDRYLGLGDLYSTARCYCGLGVISGIIEDYRMALEYFEDGLSAARRASREHLAATLTGNIGHIYFKMGRYEDARKCFEYGLQFYKQMNEPHGSANMLLGIAGIHVYQGEHSLGLELARRAIELQKKAIQHRGIAVAMGNVGLTLQKMGKLDEALVEFKRTLNYAKAHQLKVTEHEMLKSLSKIYSEMGMEDLAKKHLDLYIESQNEDQKAAVKEKNEQFRQRQQIRDLKRQR